MLIGIVGKPSSGKSTFLNAACLTHYKTANYPFTTIKPNMGESYARVKCVCKELGVEDNPKNSICIDGIRLIPVKLLDVAGLVPGAHKGKGMGNQFLSDLSQADVLIHVIDISGSLDSDGQDIDEGSHNPVDDIRFLEEEINYWFRNLIIKNDWNKFIRKIVQEKLSFVDVLYERLAGISVKKEHIVQTISDSSLDFEAISKWSDEDVFNFAKNLRERSKPIIVAANKIDRKTSQYWYEKLIKENDVNLVPCTALSEFVLRQYAEKKILRYVPGANAFRVIDEEKLSEKELQALKNIDSRILSVYGSTGIQKVINHAIFDVLGYVVVYPVYDANNYSDKDGRVLPDAHLVPKGTKLKQFVNDFIHSDLAKNFIYGVDARSKMRLGENYELKNHDIVRIVTAAKSK